MSGLIGWKAANNGAGKRIWFVMHEERVRAGKGFSYEQMYHCDKKGKVIRYSSYKTANQKAKELNDPSCGTTWGETENGYYLLDVITRRMEYPELKHTMQAYADKWNPTSLLVEDKASGQSVLQDLRLSTRLPIIPVNPTTDKVVRLMAVSALFESGRVWLPEAASWLADYEAELITFPNGAHDDQVDSTSQALSFMSSRPTMNINPQALAKMGITIPTLVGAR